MHESIRQVDDKKLLFIEPVTFDQFAVGFTGVPGGSDYANRTVLAYHYYWPVPNFLFLGMHISRRVSEAQRLGCGLMMTEFDVNINPKTGNPDGLLDRLRKADEKLQSWVGWVYKPFYAITGPGESIIDSKTGQVRQEYVRLFSRTYAHAVAGIVKKMDFNDETRVRLLFI